MKLGRKKGKQQPGNITPAYMPRIIKELQAEKYDPAMEILGEAALDYFGRFMQVWNIMEDRHLPMYIPDYVKMCNWYHPGMTEGEIEAKNGFKPRRTAPTLGKGDNPASEIWALADNLEIPMHDRIVLFTTFDDCLVKKEDIPRVIEAFRAFEGDDHKGETNLGEQADILQTIYDNLEAIAVGWNQTSVICESWANVGGHDEEKEEPIPYNCLTGDKHYWLFDELKGAEA